MKKRMPAQVELLLRLHELETNDHRPDKVEAIQEVTNSLDPSLLKRYFELKKRKGTAVARLENLACSGCHMLYPQTHEMLRYDNFVHICEFCGRLLVLKGNVA